MNDFPYTITRSRRKTLAIHVAKDATVEVRAPLRLPKTDIERFVAQKQAWIEKAVHKMRERKDNAVVIGEARESELRDKAAAVIPERVAFYAKLMGVTPAAVKINGAKTRWGSCSGKNSLNFSWRLMLCEPDAVDYVVVHELAHIREHNHSPRFWAVVAEVLPDYKARRKMLRELHSIVE